MTNLRTRLADPAPLLAVELRPPRRELDGVLAMEAWIDVYHAVRRLSALDTLIFITDNAIGTSEEQGLAHLVNNLGTDAVRERIAPFLTLKHELEYCLRFAERVQQERFPALVVLGGDRHDGIARCLPHSYQLRARLRETCPGLLLGGWVNPYRDAAAQAELVTTHAAGLDFLLSQVVSHHRIEPLARLVEELGARGIDLPLFAGVFFYRSASRRTLRRLGEYLPVPDAQIVADFEERGMTAVDVAAATVQAGLGAGVSRFYVSNLRTAGAAADLARIGEAAGLGRPARG